MWLGGQYQCRNDKEDHLGFVVTRPTPRVPPLLCYHAFVVLVWFCVDFVSPQNKVFLPLRSVDLPGVSPRALYGTIRQAPSASKNPSNSIGPIGRSAEMHRETPLPSPSDENILAVCSDSFRYNAGTYDWRVGQPGVQVVGRVRVSMRLSKNSDQLVPGSFFKQPSKPKCTFNQSVVVEIVSWMATIHCQSIGETGTWALVRNLG